MSQLLLLASPRSFLEELDDIFTFELRTLQSTQYKSCKQTYMCIPPLSELPLTCLQAFASPESEVIYKSMNLITGCMVNYPLVKKKIVMYCSELIKIVAILLFIYLDHS